MEDLERATNLCNQGPFSFCTLGFEKGTLILKVITVTNYIHRPLDGAPAALHLANIGILARCKNYQGIAHVFPLKFPLLSKCIYLLDNSAPFWFPVVMLC